MTNKKYETYKKEQRREKNKIRKLTKYLKLHPKNLVAATRLQALIKLVKGEK